MELRSQAKVSGPQARPRATSEGRTQLGTDRRPLGLPGTGRKLPASSRRGWSVQGRRPTTP